MPDSVTAVNVALPILIKTYGVEEIENQKPFEVYLISNYWFIHGTRPKLEIPKGVTITGGDGFTMVIDAFNAKILSMFAGEYLYSLHHSPVSHW